MEFENLAGNHQQIVPQRLLSAVVPVLFIAISYVDPGKWVAAVDGGARFGFDFILLLAFFNSAAIFCHYMSARIAVVSGRDLAQICSDEYDNITSVFLGAQAEVSLIALDLMMVLGTAHGLNILFGIDLFTGVFLTAVNAILFPFLAMLLENGKVKHLSACLSIFILLFYVFGVFISQPGNSLSMGGTLTRLSGECAFALMSLLGASVMPHNFYLHSSIIIQQDHRSANVPRETLCHDHFFAILCIFSGIFLVNYMLMNSAANVTGLNLSTFQDALDQVFRSSIAPMALILLTFFSNQVTALGWNLGGQVIMRDFFKMDIPGWLHHFTIRIIAIIPALYCVWNSGAEGIYQLLIFTQVVIALMLPSSVIPLFRVASSRSVMGIHKISQFEELLALITFAGMLGLKILFFIELTFGESEWVSNLRWNTGSSVPIAYVILVVAASVSFCLMLWLAATPLRSATLRIDSQVLDWGMQTTVPEGKQNDVSVSEYQIDELMDGQEPSLALERSLGGFPDLSTSSPSLNLPDSLYDSENVLHLTTIEEKKSEITFPSTSACHQEPSVTEGETKTAACGEPSGGESQDDHVLKSESIDVIEKTLRMDGDSRNEKGVGESWKAEEPIKGVSETNQSLTSEGPGSFRSLSGKGDEPGSGAGSLSRLAGLGRAARRQLTGILEDFWGQMFDYHGQFTPEAKANKLDMLFGLDCKDDSKSSSTSVKLDGNRKDFAPYFPSLAGGGSDSLSTSALYNSPKHQTGPSVFEPSYGVQRSPSSLWSPHIQLLDAYVRNSSRNTFDSGERRYSSMHIPSSSDAYDQQPATVHGYELASYVNRMAKEKGSGFLNGPIEPLGPKSTPLLTSRYGDSFARPIAKKTLNGVSSQKPPGFHNITISRNTSLQSDRSLYDLSSPKPAENVNGSPNAKKFYSLPDISGLRIPHQDSSLTDGSGQQDNSVAYRQAYSGYARTTSSLSPRVGSPLRFEEFPPSKVCRDAFTSQFNSGSSTDSLWSRQPFEQFGVADKNIDDEQVGSLSIQENPSVIDLEAKLLQSFRYCTMKLLKLEGSDRLFRQNDGADEDLIDRVAAREKFLYEAETLPMNRLNNACQSQLYTDHKPGSALRSDEADYAKFLVTSVPHCGEGCIYKVDLIISFGVWCIHRVLELSLMESRPELWGRYTYVLNRLQGIIDLAFFKPRSPMTPCFCLQLPVGWQKSSPPVSNGSLPPHAKPGRGKYTTAAMLLDLIKDVETAISRRKGRTGTAAGDVAFPIGKENLASVLKRYKRRLSNKPIGSQESGSMSRKVSSPLHYGL